MEGRYKAFLISYETIFAHLWNKQYLCPILLHHLMPSGKARQTVLFKTGEKATLLPESRNCPCQEMMSQMGTGTWGGKVPGEASWLLLLLLRRSWQLLGRTDLVRV